MSKEIDKIVIPDSIEIMNQIEKAAIDVQISTAKQFPRDIERVVQNCIATVTLDEKIASTCGYNLGFRGKEIKGKSVNLARIIAQMWGNLRCDQTVIGSDQTHVIGQGICHDLETNFAIRVQVKKPIIKKDGVRYTNDMIATAGMAASAIALRNAILQVIPQAFSDKIYEAAERKLIDALSKEDRLISKRTEMITKFNDSFKVTEAQILKHFEVRTVNLLDPLKVKELIDLFNACTDKSIDVNEVFGVLKKAETSKEKAEENKELFTNDKKQ